MTHMTNAEMTCGMQGWGAGKDTAASAFTMTPVAK